MEQCTAPPASVVVDFLKLQCSKTVVLNNNQNVQSPPLNLDKNETNDSISKGYLLPMTFVNDSAYTNTIGSNIHIGTDNDYYKMILPKGYSYSIKPTLNDLRFLKQQVI